MSEMNDVVVTAVARTPFGRFNGALKSIEGPTLGARIIDALLERSRLPAERVDALYSGVGMIASAVLTPARLAVLRSRLPQTVPSFAVDRACCSGMTAIGLGFKDLRAGASAAVICGGFDNLSRTPLLLPRTRERPLGAMTVDDPLLLRAPGIEQPIAAYTAEEALRHGVDRAQQDEWAVASHRRYFAAEADGYFDFERVPVTVAAKAGEVVVTSDESPRADTSIEKLAALPTIYGSRTITPGNAPGLNDGAAFVAMVTRRVATELGLPVLARIIDYAQVADAPTSGSYTPAIAIAAMLERQHLAPQSLDAIEINEAYAATPLVSTLVLAEDDLSRARALRERTNRHGGAVAIGHPLGASGARVVITLINGLRRRGGGLGAAAICGGFGQGDGVLLEVRE
jgi:acetyl-CoA C-acetyltransferase